MEVLKIRNKKGSHVGVVLSFTLFVGFLVFSYVLIGPTLIKKDDLSENIKVLEREAKKEITERVEAYWVYTESAGCVSVTAPNTISQSTHDIFAIDGGGDALGAEIDGSNNKVQAESTDINGGLVKIYVSANGTLNTPTPPGGSNCPNTKIIGNLTEERIFEKKILTLIERIEDIAEYQSLKNTFGLGRDFQIMFRYSNGTIIGSQTTSANVDIYSEEIFINYLSANAEEKTGALMLRVW